MKDCLWCNTQLDGTRENAKYCGKSCYLNVLRKFDGRKIKKECEKVIENESSKKVQGL